MKVRLLRNPAKRYGCSLGEGETGQVDHAIGSALVKAGIAECLDPPAEIKAVPEQPAIAQAEGTVEKAEEDLRSYRSTALREVAPESADKPEVGDTEPASAGASAPQTDADEKPAAKPAKRSYRTSTAKRKE